MHTNTSARTHYFTATHPRKNPSRAPGKPVSARIPHNLHLQSMMVTDHQHSLGPNSSHHFQPLSTRSFLASLLALHPPPPSMYYINALPTQSSFSFLSTKSTWPNHRLSDCLYAHPISLLHTSFLLSQRVTSYPPNHLHFRLLHHHRFMFLLHQPCLTSIHHATLDTVHIDFKYLFSFSFHHFTVILNI